MAEVDWQTETVTNDYARSLEERVMQLEAQVAQLEAQSMRDDLEAEGYRRDPGNEADRSACRSAACEKCGHVGLAYEAWTRRTSAEWRTSYRPFAICSKCGNREEF